MNKKTILILVAVALVMAGAGGGAAYFFLKGDAAEAAEAAPPAVPGLVELEPFLTNISDPRTERHARLQVKLAVSPKERADEVKADELLVARLRDQVLTMLNAASYEELTATGGKDAFRTALKEKLAPVVEPGTLDEVLFSDFVIQ